MIVISDTSPLYYLILIDCIDVLPLLYEKVMIPPAVYQELQANKTPKTVRQWIQHPPHWLIVQPLNTLPSADLDKLDQGEREAITLAEQINADWLILDDKLARTIATQRGLQIIGLLGILYEAAQANLIDLSSKFNELQKTTFFVSPQLLTTLVQQFNNNNFL